MGNYYYSVFDVFEISDNNICPRLIMIIINFIILYFEQITHTNDFPSKGTRLVQIEIGCSKYDIAIYYYCVLLPFLDYYDLLIVQLYG